MNSSSSAVAGHLLSCRQFDRMALRAAGRRHTHPAFGYGNRHPFFLRINIEHSAGYLDDAVSRFDDKRTA